MALFYGLYHDDSSPCAGLIADVLPNNAAWFYIFIVITCWAATQPKAKTMQHWTSPSAPRGKINGGRG